MSRTWRAGSFEIPLDRTRVMGVVNVTPDSFSDGGRYVDVDAAIAHGKRLAEEGADVLDVGGESTRPGAREVSVEEEAQRVVPVIRGLAKETDVPVSVDTRKARVAKEALDAGAAIVNDVTAGTYDEELFPLVARARMGLVLMHMQGRPETMQQDPRYDDVVREVGDYLAERAAAAVKAGVPADAIVVDPGIGFGKTPAHNVALLGHAADVSTDYPVLVGASRKSTIGRLMAGGGEVPPADDRLEGTIAAHVLAVARGADLVRVHDVRAVVRALRVADAILGKGGDVDG